MVTTGILVRMKWSERGDLREVLRSHPLVHLAAPDLSPGELVDLARSLGEVEPARRINFRLPGYPEITCFGNVRNERGEEVAGSAVGLGFHSDMSYRPDACQLTFLHAVRVPRRGGDTHFVSLYRLHDDLDAGSRRAWRKLEAEHVAASDYFANAPDCRSIHPLVVRHPDSGRLLVFACPAYMRRILGVSGEESQRILSYLAGAMDPPDHVHRWQPEDLLVWDNRAVLHCATPHPPGQERLLWRVSVRLEVPPPRGEPARSSDRGSSSSSTSSPK